MCGPTSKTCWTSYSPARRTTTACCRTCGNKRIRRRSARTASKSGEIKPTASNSTRPAAASPPAAALGSRPDGPASPANGAGVRLPHSFLLADR